METIVKCRRNSGYAKISNALLQNKTLSFRARGLMAFILSLPDDWTIRVDSLPDWSEKEGRDAVRTAMKELVAQRYLVGALVQDKEGKIRGRQWTAYDEPETTVLLENRPTVNPMLQRKEVTKETLIKEKEVEFDPWAGIKARCRNAPPNSNNGLTFSVSTAQQP